jgi:hypothetical protein
MNSKKKGKLNNGCEVILYVLKTTLGKAGEYREIFLFVEKTFKLIHLYRLEILLYFSIINIQLFVKQLALINFTTASTGFIRFVSKVFSKTLGSLVSRKPGPWFVSIQNSQKRFVL